MTLQLGSAELLLFKDTSATTDEVSLPYIDDISPRELKAAEVMVKEEVRDIFFSTHLDPIYRLFPAFDDRWMISFCDKSARIASDITIARR